jgi:hypothetical protein
MNADHPVVKRVKHAVRDLQPGADRACLVEQLIRFTLDDIEAAGSPKLLTTLLQASRLIARRMPDGGAR